MAPGRRNERPPRVSDTQEQLQVQRRVSVDIDRVRLGLRAALQDEANDLFMTKARAEVEGDVVFVVLGID